MIEEMIETSEVIVNCLLVGRGLVLSDVPSHQIVAADAESLGCSSCTFIVETHAVNQRFVFLQPEESGFWIAGLCHRG